MSTVTLEELFAKYETLQRELETAEIIGNSFGAPTTKTQRRLESKTLEREIQLQRLLLQRRKVEAFERIAWALEAQAHAPGSAVQKAAATEYHTYLAASDRIPTAGTSANGTSAT